MMMMSFYIVSGDTRPRQRCKLAKYAKKNKVVYKWKTAHGSKEEIL
jgi:hypothetical protein